MKRFKLPGCELDLSLTYFYASLAYIGEVCIEYRAVVRGRWWLDYMHEKGCLELFAGQTHIILSRPYKPTSGQELPSAP